MIKRKHIFSRWLVVLLAVNLGSGCHKDQQTISAKTEKGSLSPKTKSLREGCYVVRSLLEEVSRSELSRDGLLLMLGTPDRNKYIRGGWGTGWGEKTSTDMSHLDAVNQKVKLFLTLVKGGAQSIWIHLRSPKIERNLTLYLDNKAIATEGVKTAFSTLKFKLEKPIEAGYHRVTLAFSKKPSKGAVAQVSWLWIPDADENNPNEKEILAKSNKMGSMTLDSPRRALLADAPSRFSYYLVVPEESAFVFDYGAKKETTFQVIVDEDGAEPKTIFEKPSTNHWTEAKVDLSPWAGKVVRLDLVTRGSGNEAGWGEPEIVREGTAPSNPPVTQATAPRNLIYILIDTARQDAFRPFNPQSDVETPAFNQLAKESTIFLNAYSDDNWTKPSVATALTGLYTSTHETRDFESELPKDIMLISQHLKKQGFETSAFIANGYISDKFGFKKGWDSYRNYIRENRKSQAEYVYRDATAWLKEPHKRRFFLYIQAIDPHVPYAVPKEYLSKYYKETYHGKLGKSVTGIETKKFLEGKLHFDDTDKAYVHALYKGEITYHDTYFGKFLEVVNQLGRSKDTLIVVSNDHGEEMFEHDRVGHGHSLHEELLRNPLLFSFPPLFQKGEKVKTPVELVDLVPTVLEALAVPPMPVVDGTSLMPLIHGRTLPIYGYPIAEFGEGQRAIRLGDFKMITTLNRKRLFNVVKDRTEKENIIDSQAIVHRACEIYLAEGLAVPKKSERLLNWSKRRRFKARKVKIDPELRKQLEALGYIDN